MLPNGINYILVFSCYGVTCLYWVSRFGCISELDSCTSSRKVVADMATVTDSCQGAGNLVIPVDPIPVKKTHTEHCETVVASWNQFR